MTSEIVVRRADPGDAPLMTAIHGSCFARAWDEAAMAQLLANPEVLCLIGANCNAPGAVGGLLIARRAADEAEILTVCVTPAGRQAGLGRALLQAAIEALRASGAKQLFLEVEVGNVAAQRLYRTFGATLVGKRQGYYENGADAAIFSLAL